MPPTQLKRAERLAKKENRTLSELVREALRQYEQKKEIPVNTDLIAALRAVQEDARRSGLDKMSQREINAEVERPPSRPLTATALPPGVRAPWPHRATIRES
jgi:predicted transcriptional regulator